MASVETNALKQLKEAVEAVAEAEVTAHTNKLMTAPKLPNPPEKRLPHLSQARIQMNKSLE